MFKRVVLLLLTLSVESVGLTLIKNSKTLVIQLYMLRPKMELLETFKIYLDIYRKLIGEIKKDTRLYFWQVKEYLLPV